MNLKNLMFQFASSTPESGSSAAYNGAKKNSGLKIHAVVDTFSHLMALRASAGNVDDRAAVWELCESVQEVTGQHVEVMFADQGYTAEAAQAGARVKSPKLLHLEPFSRSRWFSY